MIVAGVMSGTSADGIDVALVRVEKRRGDSTPKLQYLAHAAYPYPNKVRDAVLAAMNSSSVRVDDLARLNFLLAELYSEAVLKTQSRFRTVAQLVGCHGQTLYHQGEPEQFLGRKIACTWQTGESSIIAARLGIPVVSDFRPADMAAGGKGAPLVPFLDYLLYRHDRFGRIVQNLGGIGNLTAIPASASPEQVIAFDTGPANMVIDAVTERLFSLPYDRDGAIAASGRVLEPVIKQLLRMHFFRRRPPKTTGREQFGREFVSQFIKLCKGSQKEDVVATATALSAKSIGLGIQTFVLRNIEDYREYIVSGGGTNNPILLAMIANQLRPMGLALRVSDEFGLPSAAKEAVAFALLAYRTWNRQPSNIPSATGAKRLSVLGKISYA